MNTGVIVEKLEQEDVPIGMPLAWSVFDEDGAPLLEEGAVLTAEAQRTFLFTHFHPRRGKPLDVPGIERASAALPMNGGEPYAGGEVPSLAEMGLAIGAPLGIRPHTRPAQPVRQSRLIGAAPDGTLFVTQPKAVDGTPALAVGQQLEVVSVSRQAVFWCVCTARGVCSEPLAYATLSEPRQIRRLRRRAAARMPVHLAVRVAVACEPSAHYESVALARDISADGMSLLAPAPLGPVGTALRLSFRLHSNELDLGFEVKAVIRHLPAVADPQRPISHGVRFEALDTQQQLALKAYVLDRLCAA